MQFTVELQLVKSKIYDMMKTESMIHLKQCHATDAIYKQKCGFIHNPLDIKFEKCCASLVRTTAIEIYNVCYVKVDNRNEIDISEVTRRHKTAIDDLKRFEENGKDKLAPCSIRIAENEITKWNKFCEDTDHLFDEVIFLRLFKYRKTYTLVKFYFSIRLKAD